MTKKNTKSKTAAIEAPGVEIGEQRLFGKPEVHDLKVSEIRIQNKTDRTRDKAFERSVQELAANIAHNGLINPITVRRVDRDGVPSDGVFDPKGYHLLVAGERRLLAYKLLKRETIPAIEISAAIDVLDARAAENLQREDLDEDEKAFTVGAMIDREVRTLLDEQGVKELSDLDAPGIDALNVAATKRVAERMGWPVSRVRDYAFTAELPEEVLTLARQGRLPMGHLRVLAQIPDPKRAIQLAENYAAGENPALEPVKSLDDLKTMVSRETCRLAGVPWDLNVEFAGAPACAKCPHNSANRTGLFDGPDLKPDFTSQFDAVKAPLTDKAIEAGLCSKLSCYRAKTRTTKAAWRGVGDRIAAKVKAAKPAERAKLLPQLVKEAAEKCAFIPVTVMGKLVKARAEQKLEAGTPAKKAKDAADRSVKAANDAARRKAEDAHRRAENEWFSHRLRELEKYLKGWSVEQQAMLYLLVSWSQVGHDLIGWDAAGITPARLNAFKLLLRNIAGMPGTNPLPAILTNKPKRPVFLGPDGDEMEVPVLRAMLDTLAFEYPEPPVLADFLPKPEAKKPAADKKAKPAKKAGKKRAAPKSSPDASIENELDGEEE